MKIQANIKVNTMVLHQM